MTNSDHPPTQQTAATTDGGGFVAIQLKDSSNISAARFDPKTGVLEVKFSSGGVYTYAGFTELEARAWGEAKSTGSWFDSNVKKRPAVHPLVETVAKPAEKAAVKSADGSFGSGAPPAGEPAAPLDVNADAVTPDVLEMAEALYRAYTKNSGGKAWDGRPCPDWTALGHPVRSHWCAAALIALSSAPTSVMAGTDHGELAGMVTQVAHLKKVAKQAEQLAQSKLDAEVMARTKMLDGEVESLRAQVAKLEAQKRTFAPWRNQD